MRLCAMRWDWYLVLKPHVSHRYGRDALWVARCCSSVPRVAKLFSQSSHLNGFSPATRIVS
jgi:hypothetical protein